MIPVGMAWVKFQPGGWITAAHVTTGARVRRAWDDRQDAIDNCARVAAELFGGVLPNVSAAIETGGFVFGWVRGADGEVSALG